MQLKILFEETKVEAKLPHTCKVADSDTMETGTLFRLTGKADVYRAVFQKDWRCDGCAGYKRNALCQRLPFCAITRERQIFVKLNRAEVRGYKNAKKTIIVYNKIRHL